ALQSHDYATYPLYEIQAKTDQKQDLISHIMIFENYPVMKRDTGTITKILNINMREETNYDFNVIVMPGEEIELQLHYNQNKFVLNQISRIKSHFLHVLSQIIENPYSLTNEIQLITSEELIFIQENFNKTLNNSFTSHTMHGLFEKQVTKTPNNIAITFNNEKITYKELNEKSNQLARLLKQKNVSSQQLIGIMTERSINMVVGILAILKIGAVYVPIDPEYPEDRINYIINDSGIKTLLISNEDSTSLNFIDQLISLSDNNISLQEKSNIDCIVDATDLAYIIYTSGTTGNPKGVMLEHRNICNLKLFFGSNTLINESDRILQFASMSFDASIWEIFSAFFFGASIHIPTKEIILDQALMTEFMQINKITMATFPPAYANYLEPKHLPHLKKLITAGSSPTKDLMKKWMNRVQYINAYGPTEDAICTTAWIASENSNVSNPLVIGSALPNHQVYIMNEESHILPMGIVGELCIAGYGLARGYLNRPDLTKEKFQENQQVLGKRIYKTGDLARYLPDGNIEYLGRIDHQVKIRGYRIELGEIESQLLNIDAIEEVCLVACKDNEDTELCAYFVANHKLETKTLKQMLARTLPSYMIPAFWVQLEMMPLTPNGKVDRKALPSPKQSVIHDKKYMAPRTNEEMILNNVWIEVLGIQKIGIDDNFFELGGDSIKSIQVSSRLLRKGYQLEIKRLFGSPTIRELANFIKSTVRNIEQGQIQGKVEITAIQQWFFEHQTTESSIFNQSFMLYNKEEFSESALHSVWHKLVEHHDALRMVFLPAEQAAGYQAWN
ncbi:amino acid adenylation domain-containing protein, partial [Paenibacillus sp. EKM208P]